MNTAGIGILLRVLTVLLFGFGVGMILPFGLMQGTDVADLLTTRLMTGFFAPVMVVYLGKDLLNPIAAASLFLLIGFLLTLYIGGMVTGILSLRGKMAFVFAILLASLWDILVLAACLLSHLD